MTATARDVLVYAKSLETAGFSHEQAFAIAEGAGNVMEQRVETLVTQAHFDAAMASVDHRFDMVDQRLTLVEKTLHKLEDVPSDLRLHTWMLAITMLVLVVPKLQEWFAS